MKNKSFKSPTRLRKLVSPSSSCPLAFGLPALLFSGVTLAQDDEPFVLDTMQIEERTIDTNPYAEPGAPYKAKVSGDERHVKPLAETPQTISVLTQTQIQESGRTDLRDVLAAQPGITLGTGENGNAFGDRYVIRGHEARSDVFVDGLRDPGMTTRESFATEQVEITKGPSSTFAGRGSTGGAVNSQTKQASSEYNFNKVEGSLGTDDYRRVTLDSNNKISEDLAVRVNLLYGYEEVPDRSPADKERTGVALSGRFQASNKLSFLADYYYLDAQDKPDLGTYIESGGGDPVEDIPVYQQKQDFLESNVQAFTLRAAYEINDNIRITNSARYGVTDNGYVVTGARGTVRDQSDPVAANAATISLSTHQGWQEVDYFVNQLNTYIDSELAGMQHQWLISAEYSTMSVLNGTYNVENNGATNCITAGRRGASESYCLLDGNGNVVTNSGELMDRSISKGDFDSDYQVDTLSLSVMDTVDLTDKLSVFGGVRLDSFDYTNDVVRTDRETGEKTTTNFDYTDTLWNGHLGTLYQLTQEGNIYATYSTSSNINGGESDVGSSCGYGGLCGDETQVTESKPERTTNLEIGTKWNVLNEKLLLSAAFFQITKDDVMESVGDDYATLGTLNTGKNRVEGFEVSATGNITEDLSTQFGFSMMNSEILEAYNDTDIGKRLSNFADDSAFVQLRYQLTEKLAIGSSVTYSSEMYSGQPDTAAGYSTDEETGDYSYSYKVPSYTVVDAFASYKFSENLNMRLNVGNVTDTDYYLAAYRSGAFTYIGDARNAQLSLSYEF